MRILNHKLICLTMYLNIKKEKVFEWMMRTAEWLSAGFEIERASSNLALAIVLLRLFSGKTYIYY